MRTFVAIELDDECRRKLVRAQEELRGSCGGVRWVRPDGLHLTLKFIGELAETDVSSAASAISSAASQASPFRMTLEGISGFPPKGRPRIIFARVEEPHGVLAALAQAVDSGLCEALGIAPEERSFKSHVTLGRVQNPRDCPPVPELSGLVADDDFGEVAVDSVVLMKSDLTPRGAIYTPLERIRLHS